MLDRADELAARNNYHGQAIWRRIYSIKKDGSPFLFDRVKKLQPIMATEAANCPAIGVIPNLER
jgi:hypothetical protein